MWFQPSVDRPLTHSLSHSLAHSPLTQSVGSHAGEDSPTVQIDPKNRLNRNNRPRKYTELNRQTPKTDRTDRPRKLIELNRQTP